MYTVTPEHLYPGIPTHAYKVTAFFRYSSDPSAPILLLPVVHLHDLLLHLFSSKRYLSELIAITGTATIMSHNIETRKWEEGDRSGKKKKDR